MVRTLPVAMARAGLRRVTVGFLGWFGPRGLASIVFALILLEGPTFPSARSPATDQPPRGHA